MSDGPRTGADDFAGEALAAGDPTGWFDRLYAAAEAGTARVPWDHEAPNPVLVAPPLPAGEGRRALVVGAGLGDDAEHVAGAGYATTAFDVAPRAIAAAQRRFPSSPVHYEVANLLEPPRGWLGAFDLVVESFTVQSLPPDLRARATANVTGFVAPGGTLLVIASAREPQERIDGPPWPLARAEVEAFAGDGALELVALDERQVPEARFPRVWRAELRRPHS